MTGGGIIVRRLLFNYIDPKRVKTGICRMNYEIYISERGEPQKRNVSDRYMIDCKAVISQHDKEDFHLFFINQVILACLHESKDQMQRKKSQKSCLSLI